jgi:hypothetical protein
MDSDVSTTLLQKTMPEIKPERTLKDNMEEEEEIFKVEDKQINIQIRIEKFKDIKNQREAMDLIYFEHCIFVAVSQAILIACPGTTIDAITSVENLTTVKA